MLSVIEADRCIISHSRELQSARCVSSRTFDGSYAVAAQDLTADRDFPPYDRVAMDGIAINFASYQAGRREFLLESTQAAGSAAHLLKDQERAIEVMTGSVLPTGTNTVIRYEDLSITLGCAKLTESITIKMGQNVHKRGSDCEAGKKLVEAGQIMLPPQWAIAASVGQATVNTRACPRISIIGTGDELCDIDSKPQEHQIRASNIYAIAAAIRDYGFNDIQLFIVPDDPQALENFINKSIDNSDLCIITGAVSAGKYDLVPQILKKLEVQEIFHKIAQRPGKPLWFGKSQNKTLIFGLPGNPVSSLICCYRYVIPCAFTIMGAPRPRQIFAELTRTINFGHGNKMTLFHPINIASASDSKLLATPLLGVGSGDLASLCQSDGFVECQAGSEVFAAGQSLPCYLWSRI